VQGQCKAITVLVKGNVLLQDVTDMVCVYPSSLPRHKRTIANALAAAHIKTRTTKTPSTTVVDFACQLDEGEYDVCYCRGCSASVIIETSTKLKVMQTKYNLIRQKFNN
jgi:hypothetical protein